MPKLWIDNREVEVPEGSTILDAARKLGIDVPALCFLEGRDASTSCMCCVVKIAGREGLAPSCATTAAEGMRVESESDAVRAARREALELLLSDHLGDCVAPCQSICPAGMDIPRMVRLVRDGRMREAVATIKAHIALPAVLGRICPAPCEKGCRRGAHDAPVSIMLLKRYAADADLAGEPFLPDCRPATGKSVAVVGAGPAGLAAAYTLRRMGHACTVFDDRDAPGGMLRYGVGEDRLPRDVLDAEIAVIERLGVNFRLNTLVGRDIPPANLQADHNAILLATGERKKGSGVVSQKDGESPETRHEKTTPDPFFWPGVKVGGRGVEVDGKTFQTAAGGVFAAGDATGRRRLTVRAVAEGRAAAIAIDQYVTGADVVGVKTPFTLRVGKLREGEIDHFLPEARDSGRVAPAGGPGAGYVEAEAREEAARCLHCDCRGADTCTLRRHADAYAARPTRFRGERRTFEQHREHPEVLHEPGKCIACGLCVQIAAEAGEPLGLTFVNRGMDVRVAVPFGRPLSEGLRRVAAECVAACPTAALSFKSAAADERGEDAT